MCSTPWGKGESTEISERFSSKPRPGTGEEGGIKTMSPNETEDAKRLKSVDLKWSLCLISLSHQLGWEDEICYHSTLWKVWKGRFSLCNSECERPYDEVSSVITGPTICSSSTWPLKNSQPTPLLAPHTSQLLDFGFYYLLKVPNFKNLNFFPSHGRKQTRGVKNPFCGATSFKQLHFWSPLHFHLFLSLLICFWWGRIYISLTCFFLYNIIYVNFR